MKKHLCISLLAGITAIAASGAAIVLNKQQPAKLAGAATVSHKITFTKNDNIVLTSPANEKGTEITKNNATKSGDPFVMKAYCYGNGTYNTFNNSDFLLYCETKGTNSADPNSYVRLDFSLSNVASFTNIILYGGFFYTSDKNLKNDSITVPATYDSVNNRVTGRIDRFKIYVTSIELNYTCAA